MVFPGFDIYIYMFRALKTGSNAFMLSSSLNPPRQPPKPHMVIVAASIPILSAQGAWVPALRVTWRYIPWEIMI